MAFGKRRRKRFETAGLDEIDISLVKVNSIQEGHYFVQSGTYDPGTIQGGYELDVFGDAGGSYWRGREEITAPGYRVHIKIDSSPERHEFNEGVIGGGRFHDEYAEIELSMDPDYLRDILYELRRDPQRELRVSGFAISDKVFRAMMFMLSAPQV